MSNRPVIVVQAGPRDAEALGDVAAATFPLACPPGATREDIEIFIGEMLSGERFAEYLSDPARIVLEAVVDDDIVGYAMLVTGGPASAAGPQPLVELSKMYVLPGLHGTGVSTALMNAVLERARAEGYQGVWLGVNQENVRARRFYAKHGFTEIGTRTFTVGAQVHHDYVLRLVF